jgi:type II secretory pathway pseudopilin PulG
MRKLKGITIIETLIYLALFGIIFIAIVEFFITMRDNNKVAIEKINLEKVTIYLTNHVSDSFKNSLSVDEATSIFENNASKVRIVKTGKYVEYSLVNNILLFSDNGTNKVILDPDYKVTRFYLERILNDKNILQGIRMELTVTSIKNAKNTKTIQTSYILK